MAESQRTKTPRDILQLVFRRKKLFLLGASLVAIAVLLMAQHVPLKYTGTTLFERRKDAAVDQSRGAPPSESFETVKLTLQLDLIGRNAVEEAAKELGLEQGLPHDKTGKLTPEGEGRKHDLVLKLIKNLTVTQDVDSSNVDVIKVSVVHSDPVLAQRIPDTLVENYIERTSKRDKLALQKSRSWLQGQADDVRARLDRQIKEKARFLAKHGESMPERPGEIERRLDTINSDMDAQIVIRQSAESTLKQLESQMRYLTPTTQSATQPAEIVTEENPDLKDLQKQLRDSKNALKTMLTLRRLKAEHPDIKVMKTRIADLEQEIEQTPAERVKERVYRRTMPTDMARQAVAAQMAAARSMRDAADRAVKRLEARKAPLERLRDNFAQVRQEWEVIIEDERKIRRETEAKEEKLRSVASELELTMAGRSTHVRVIEFARVQDRPSSPSLMMVVGAALFVGLASGAGLVFLSKLIDRSVATAEDATRYFDLPIHGIISEIVSRGDKLKARLSKWVMWPCVTALILVVLGAAAFSNVLRLKFPEQYRQWQDDRVAYVSGTVTQLSDTVRDLFF